MESSAVARRRQQRRVPNDKRKRTAIACVRCKARKSKCIRSAFGSCQRCHQNALPCEYSGSNSINQGREHGRRDTTLVDDNAPLAVVENIYSTPAGGSMADACQSERFMWSGFLAKLRESFSLDPSPSIPRSFSQQGPGNSLAPDVDSAELKRLRWAIQAFPPRAQADHLLNVLIEHGTDSFFYFDQAEFLAVIDDFYQNGLTDLHHKTGFVCLAHASFALGSQWLELANPETSAVSLYDVDGDIGRHFYEQARSLVPDLDDAMSLESVQAPFVLGVYLLPTRATGSLHMYLGLALRKALALDLHVAIDDNQLPHREREVRSRLWWAVFSLERTLTLKLNRPRSVDSTIITVPLPQPLQTFDSGQLFDNSMHQAANATLTLILDKLAETSRWTGDEDVAVQSRVSLKAWKRSLPPSLRLDNIASTSASYRATFHLHLNYYFAWITMGKYKLVAAVRARLRCAFGTNTELSPIDGDTEQLAKSCNKAARKMLELFGRVHKTGQLTRSSFTDFQGCNIATMVLLIAGILERDLCYEARISFGLDCLRSMAEDNPTATTGVNFMEALQSIANEASGKLREVAANTLRPAMRDSTVFTPSAVMFGQLPPFTRSPPPAPSSRNLADTSLLPLESSNLSTSWSQQQNHSWAPSVGINDDHFSFLQLDNEAFPLELTGMDALGISGS